MPSQKPPNDDDDLELELEPVDPEILAAQRSRAARKTEEAVARIDPDELFPDLGKGGLGSDLVIDSWKKFRFTTRHLLILTAIVAIGLTLRQLIGVCSSLLAIAVALVAAGWFWVSREERKLAAERDRRREEFFGTTKSVATTAGGATIEGDEAAAPKPREFKFAFSLKQLFIAMTAAVVIVAILTWVGPNKLAIVLGAVALVGLVVNAAGFDPPAILVLGWWLLLVAYILVGLVAALMPAKQGAMRGGGAAPATTVARARRVP